MWIKLIIININQDIISNHLTFRKGKSEPGQVHILDQWRRNEIFLGEDLFNKNFWNYKFLAKYISTIQKFRGVKSLRFSPVPPSLVMAIAAPSEKNSELSMAYVFGHGSIHSIDLGKSYLLIKRPPSTPRQSLEQGVVLTNISSITLFTILSELILI